MKNDQKHNDLFAPESVDECIEQCLHMQDTQEHVEVKLAQKLQSIYQEDADILKSARERLFQSVRQ